MRKVYCLSQNEVLTSFSEKDANYAAWWSFFALIFIPLILTVLGQFFLGIAVVAFFMATTNDKVIFFDLLEKIKSGEYVVGKSFPNIRNNHLHLQKKQQRMQKWTIVGAVCVAITLIQHLVQGVFGWIDCIVIGIFAYYLWGAYANAKYEEKVIDLHGDIAFEACENLEAIIKMEVDETFEASCQSFSGHKRDGVVGDHLFILTSRTLFYALRKRGGWTSFRKPLSQITKLGYAYGKDDEEEYICWKFEFTDGAMLFVKLKLQESLSYPELMSKKLLEVFDYHLT